MIAALSCSGLPAEGNTNLVIGGRALDESFWAPLEGQGVLGVTVDFGGRDWPIRLAAGGMISANEERARLSGFGFSGSGRFGGGVAEASFGLLKTWSPGPRVRPYLGGGVSLVMAAVWLRISGVSVHDHARSGGGYLQGGVFWRLGESFNLGVDLRALRGTDIELFGVNGDADYTQIGLVLGWNRD